MIDYIKGIIEEIEENYIVIENNSKGYILNMSTNDIASLKDRQQIKIYTRLVVREDSLTIFGFIDRDSRKIFDLLNTVSSVGPKVALGILSVLGSADIVSSILQENSKILTKAPGIGKKTADRIILELKDKISKLSFDNKFELKTQNIGNDNVDNGFAWPAVEALVSLGYNEYEAKKAVYEIDGIDDISKIIKEALKRLGR